MAKNTHITKVIIVGESYVGKSCFLNRLCHNKYDNSYISTIGVDFGTKIIESDDEKYKLMLWDTSGQERFTSITQSYFRGTHICILMFDITSRESYYKLCKYWREMSKNNIDTKNHLIILVGSKIDLSKQREISIVEINDYCNEHSIRYFEISSKINYGFENLLDYIIDSIKEKALYNTSKTDLPPYERIYIHNTKKPEYKQQTQYSYCCYQ